MNMSTASHFRIAQAGRKKIEGVRWPNGLVCPHCAEAQHCYARGAGGELVTTNSVEGFFGLFTRSMVGIYQHCGDKHLYRYVTESDFRCNHRTRLGYDEMARTLTAVEGAEGKRQMYRKPDGSLL